MHVPICEVGRVILDSLLGCWDRQCDQLLLGAWCGGRGGVLSIIYIGLESCSLDSQQYNH